MSPLFVFMDRVKIQTLIEPIITSLGYELVDVRFVIDHGRRVLRIAIDCEAGIKVGDCERVSRELDTLIDVEGGLQSYLLEVSSPGLDRPLVKESDFVRFVGKMASLATREPIEGRRNYKGLLQGVEEGYVIMEIDRQIYRVPLALIERAHLVY